MKWCNGEPPCDEEDGGPEAGGWWGGHSLFLKTVKTGIWEHSIVQTWMRTMSGKIFNIHSAESLQSLKVLSLLFITPYFYIIVSAYLRPLYTVCFYLNCIYICIAFFGVNGPWEHSFVPPHVPCDRNDNTLLEPWKSCLKCHFSALAFDSSSVLVPTEYFRRAIFLFLFDLSLF